MEIIINFKMPQLTHEQENEHLLSLIKKSTLEEYVTLWNLIGTERLNEVLAKRLDRS